MIDEHEVAILLDAGVPERHAQAEVAAITAPQIRWATYCSEALAWIDENPGGVLAIAGPPGSGRTQVAVELLRDRLHLDLGTRDACPRYYDAATHAAIPDVPGMLVVDNACEVAEDWLDMFLAERAGVWRTVLILTDEQAEMPVAWGGRVGYTVMLPDPRSD